MVRAKTSILAACLSIALTASLGTAIAADQATDSKATDKATEAKPAAPAAASKGSDEAGKPALSKGEIRKLEAKCSDEADAKHLHGEPRKSFRAACKSKAGLKPV